MVYKGGDWELREWSWHLLYNLHVPMCQELGSLKIFLKWRTTWAPPMSSHRNDKPEKAHQPSIISAPPSGRITYLHWMLVKNKFNQIQMWGSPYNILGDLPYMTFVHYESLSGLIWKISSRDGVDLSYCPPFRIGEQGMRKLDVPNLRPKATAYQVTLVDITIRRVMSMQRH